MPRLNNSVSRCASVKHSNTEEEFKNSIKSFYCGNNNSRNKKICSTLVVKVDDDDFVNHDGGAWC
jgi:hypothetical protein